MKKLSLFFVVLGVLSGGIPVYAKEVDVAQSDETVVVENEHSLAAPVFVVGVCAVAGVLFMTKNKKGRRSKRNFDRWSALTWKRAARKDLGSVGEEDTDCTEMELQGETSVSPVFRRGSRGGRQHTMYTTAMEQHRVESDGHLSGGDDSGEDWEEQGPQIPLAGSLSGEGVE
ncbi:hypothetical protein JW872_00340 [Candidatus Babeliales bacterium]|nr:hypothetical protein [Candidatus Babeliales bacterium]